MRRTFKRLTLFALALALLVPGFAWIEPGSARAAITSADFLKADGKFLRNQSGTGDIVTLRGTNLGGWLTFEDWMSPLGEFAMDRSQWSVSASDNNSDASLAIDGDDTTRWTSGTAQTSGQWFQVDLGTVSLFNRIYIDAADFAGQHPAGYRKLGGRLPARLQSGRVVGWLQLAHGG